MRDVALRVTDLSGEHYKFKEAAFVAGRLDTSARSTPLDLWHPIQYLGEVGAAILPCLLAQALHAGRFGYAPGPISLCHVGSDAGERAALVAKYERTLIHGGRGMSKNVFANGREVSAKNDDNKSMGAMPDVCLSPPTPPAGPVPIPYPNFSQSSDTDQGTRTVSVGGSEVGIKNKSTYKTSKGDEAATKSLGMGVVSHQIQNTTYFAAWSFDVQFEGENAVRHMDLTTHNNM